MPQTKSHSEGSKDVSRINDDTLQKFVGYHLKRTSNAVLSDLAKVLKPFELRMITYTALVLIVDNPGMRQSQLATAMDIERPNLVVILDELERRDLIIREKAPTDRRAHALRATLAGRRLYERTLKTVDDHEAALLDGIDRDTLDALIQVALKIQKNASRDNT